MARTVNTTQVVANWLIGREIVEEEQKGRRRAGYGEELLIDLSERLSEDYGKGWSVRNLECCRKFYLEYTALLESQKSNALRSISLSYPAADKRHISNSARAESDTDITMTRISNAPRSESWRPGQLHPNLSWTHYRTLLRVDRSDVRAFYEIEAIQSNWSARDPGFRRGDVLACCHSGEGRNPER